jgi:hypothetical protein
VFALFFWFLGHFGQELRFLAEKTGAGAAAAAKVVIALLPNLQILNVRDMIEIPGLTAAPFVHGAAYALLYTGACLALSAALFSRKEF